MPSDPPQRALPPIVECASPPCSMHEFAAELGLERDERPRPAEPPNSPAPQAGPATERRD